MEKKMIVRRQHHNIAADIPTSSWQLIQLYTAPRQDTYRKWRENLALLGCILYALIFVPPLLLWVIMPTTVDQKK